MQSDRVVVLGGQGFIGRELVSQLCGKVETVLVVSRSAGESSRGRVHYVNGDVLDADRMMELIAGATVVYQLTIEKDLALGAHNVAEACLHHRVRRMIYTSTSDALYLGKRTTIDERAGPDAKPHLRNPYSRGKVESECLLLDYYARKRLPVVILRPSLVVGKGGKITHGGLGWWIAPTCLLGWGQGNNLLPFVLVKDVAAALFSAMDAPDIEGKAFNLGGDVFLSAREYVRLVSERSLRDFRFYPRNLSIFYLRNFFKSMIKFALGRFSEPRHYRDVMSSAMLSRIENGATKQFLGWRPNSDLEVFIQEAIDYHLAPLDPGDLRLTGARPSRPS